MPPQKVKLVFAINWLFLKNAGQVDQTLKVRLSLEAPDKSDQELGVSFFNDLVDKFSFNFD